MKKVAICLAIISIIVFVFAWSIGGIMIFNNDVANYTWVYVGLVAFIIFFCSLICLKTTRCPHCGKIKQSFGKYCPYCGKEIK